MLSRVETRGVHVGYIITCRKHLDDGDPKGTICAKTLHFGTTADRLSDGECIARLKRWFIMGNDPMLPTLAEWEPGRYRTCHKAYGGRRLCELDSGKVDMVCYGATDAELDYACAAIA